MASAKFSKNERILCYHGPLIYEAKCLEHRIREEKSEYYVHYQGWNKSWDEWVSEERILKYTNANIAIQKKVAANEEKKKENKRSKSGGKNSKTKDSKIADAKTEGSGNEADSRSSTPSGEGRSRARDGKVRGRSTPMAPTPPPAEQSMTTTLPETSVTSDSPPVVPEKRARPSPSLRPTDIQYSSEQILTNPDNAHLDIPPSLVKWLIEDWDQITRQSKLLVLPAKLTVDDILNRYKKFKVTDSSTPEQIMELEEVVRHVNDLFSANLGLCLLHKWERPQYKDLIETYPFNSASKIYGSHHFLRLFNKMNEVLAMVPKKDMDQVCDILQDILNFLLTYEKELFNVSNFGIASPEYLRSVI